MRCHFTALSRKSVGLILFGLLLILTAPAGANDAKALDLNEAVELARLHDVAYLLSRVEIQSAEVSLAQVRGMNLIDPSPSLTMQAEAGLDLAHKSGRLAEQELILQVEQAYYNVLRMEKLLDVLQAARDTSVRQLEVTKERYASGVATDIDVLKAENSVAKQDADLKQAEGNMRLSKTRLNQLIGLSEGEEIVLDHDVVTLSAPDMSLATAVEVGLTHRIELEQAAVGVQVAQKELELASNSYTTTLVRQQKEVELKKARLRSTQADQGIALDIERAYNEMEDAYNRIDLADRSLKEARRQVDIVIALTEAQMATDIEMMQAQVGVTQAEMGRVNAIFDYNIARAGFYKALGLDLAERTQQEGKEAPKAGGQNDAQSQNGM